MGACGSSIQKQDPFTAPEDFYSNYSDKKGPFFVMDANATKEIIFAKKGPASKEFCPAMTVIELFNKAVAKARGRSIGRNASSASSSRCANLRAW